jgi:uncharacterized radical SAM protein YgiQ
MAQTEWLQQAGRGLPIESFLPTTLAEAKQRGWSELDVVMVTGDAYVDHPAFGPILIARLLAARGLRVAILAQPDWRSVADFRRFGRPRLFFGVSAGNVDSMVNRLTAQKQNRKGDPYSPGGKPGQRPDRATLVYATRCREAFPEVPIVLGGIEASLRRIAHYDYWSDTVRRPILVDAKADLLVFGMGERPILEISERLQRGEPIERIRDVRGTALLLSQDETASRTSRPQSPHDSGLVELPSFEEVAGSDETARLRFAQMSRLVHEESNPRSGRPLLQRVGSRSVLFNPPSLSLSEAELDAIYDLPFVRKPHPSYAEPVPAYETVKHSLQLLRGCFGGCSFCSVSDHEGRIVQSRSAESVLRELAELRKLDSFDGVVSDLGGATANMYGMYCRDEQLATQCRRPSCVSPEICEHLHTDHGPLIELMRRVRSEPGIRKVQLSSGVRHDLAVRSPEYLRELAQHHSGRLLSVSPEHISPQVLRLMHKPDASSFEQFTSQLSCASQQTGQAVALLPSYLAGHPGSTLAEMIELALYLKRHNLRLLSVEDFVPTPMSLATAMYHTGHDPLSDHPQSQPVYSARSLRDKKLQRALLLYWDRGQHDLAREALHKAGRRDLIGLGPHSLVPPAPSQRRERPSHVPAPHTRPSAPPPVEATVPRSVVRPPDEAPQQPLT